jgi:hypothetical protein
MLICTLYQDSGCMFSRFLASIFRFVITLHCYEAAFDVQAMRYLYSDRMLPLRWDFYY